MKSLKSYYYLNVIVVLFAVSALADEGMWTFDNPPIQLVQQTYHFTITKEWLEHVRLSSVRFNDGGSGSFVSPHGLVLTNHHVARGQLQKNSSAEHDYVKDGFYAATPEQEIKSPDLEINVLISMENVTSRVEAALKGADTPEQQYKAREGVIAEIQRESLEKTGLRSDVVTLYQGGEYWLYRYKKYTDVRLVFAPEQQAAYFGGDPDNFTYPRYDLDMALFRIYENGKPIDSSNYLKWNPRGASEGELVFVSGNPGRTSRLDTLAQLLFARDYELPNALAVRRNHIQVLEAFSRSSPEHAREAGTQIFFLQNAVKALNGMLEGLENPRIIASKRTEEEKFRSAVANDARLKAQYGSAWDDIAGALEKFRPRVKERFYRDLDSQLSSLAAQIVDYVAEIKKPDGDRLPGFHESQLESLRLRLFSPAPIYDEMEIASLAGALDRDLKELGPNDPFLKNVLNGKAPEQAAADLIHGSKLKDPQVRKALVEGGEPAVANSTDAMIVLARKLDPLRREFVKWMQDNVESVERRAGEKLGQARFARYGRNVYPDATFTLRLSYGQVKSYPMNGTIAPPATTFYGLYDRATSFSDRPPFDLPQRYREGMKKLDLGTQFDFVTTNDVVGGNSGSPVINQAGEIVGLIFDGNIESLVGDYVYDIETNRSVAVHTAAMTEALRKLYGADKLLGELTGSSNLTQSQSVSPGNRVDEQNPGRTR
ncbi:MAG: S46 family peptidase [Acidobacteria bacterium]|nr:S46 family peptidase [Acidobacteriota bacterium]